MATTNGWESSSSVDGDSAVAMAIGKDSRAKGVLNSWLVLAEWEQSKDYNWRIKEVKITKVDGEVIKVDTWYKLVDGQFTED